MNTTQAVITAALAASGNSQGLSPFKEENLSRFGCIPRKCGVCKAGGCNYLPAALWFHLALCLIVIGLHNAWQPLVTSRRLFGMVFIFFPFSFSKTNEMGILSGSERISVIPWRNRWESSRGLVSLKGFWNRTEDTDESQAPLAVPHTRGQIRDDVFIVFCGQTD